jgi:hypothetical protein
MATYRVFDKRFSTRAFLGRYDAASPEEACVRAAVDPHPSIYHGRPDVTAPDPDEDLTAERMPDA